MQMMPSCDQTEVPGLVGLTHFLLDNVRVGMSVRILLRVAPRQSPSSAIRFEMSSRPTDPGSLRTFSCCPPSAPLGGIRQREQIQTGEQEKGEREQRRVRHPGRRHPASLGQSNEVGNDRHREAIDTQRWICRIQMFQFNGTSCEALPDANRAHHADPRLVCRLDTCGVGAPTVVSFTMRPTVLRLPSASRAHSRRCAGSVSACQTVCGEWRS